MMNHPANKVEKNPKRPRPIPTAMARPSALSMAGRVSGGGAGPGVDDDPIRTTSCTCVDSSPGSTLRERATYAGRARCGLSVRSPSRTITQVRLAVMCAGAARRWRCSSRRTAEGWPQVLHGQARLGVSSSVVVTSALVPIPVGDPPVVKGLAACPWLACRSGLSPAARSLTDKLPASWRSVPGRAGGGRGTVPGRRSGQPKDRT